MKKVTILPDTLDQLESLKENSQGLIKMNNKKDSSSIAATGIKVVTYLQEQLEHNKHGDPIYISPENMKALEDLLIDHHAQAVIIKELSEKNTEDDET